MSGSARSTLPAVLALDAGTSSVRGCLFGADGAALGKVVRAVYPWAVTPGGGMEAGPAALLAATAGVVDEVMGEAARQGVEVAAVAVDTFWHGIMGVEAGGAPVTPLFGWGDTRAREAARELARRVDPAAVHRRTGCWVHESYPAARLLWLRETQGDTFRRAALWVGFGEWLAMRLFGAWGVSLSIASGTGLLDGIRLCWDREMLEAVGVAEQALPPLVDAGEPFRGLLPEWARRWPALAEVPWYPALGDGGCASLGSGAAGAGRIGVTVGTSAAVRVLREAAGGGAPAELWRYRLDARRMVSGRAFSNAGSVHAWLARTLVLPPPAELEAAVAAMEPDAHGLTVIPTLLGERPPEAADSPAGTVAGLRAAVTPAQIVRASMEAVVYRVAGGVDAVERVFGPAETVLASGGVLHASRTWGQILADVLGRPLLVPAEGEETARGAALMAMEHLGWTADAVAFAARAVPGGTRIAPDPARHEVYLRARERQQRLKEMMEGEKC